MIRSMSTLAWMKSPSVDLLTVPLMPMRQCSLVLVRTALGSRMPVPEFLLLVLIQHMSSHLLKPQFWRHSRPRSRPSLEPHHRNTKLRLELTCVGKNIWLTIKIFGDRAHLANVKRHDLVPVPELDVGHPVGSAVLFQGRLFATSTCLHYKS